ncbi:MAG TPA: RNA methyltransferase [Isosphaeraceae bacterium]|nr:RNA methyltransferase [Isosphaeraceae bacterium]
MSHELPLSPRSLRPDALLREIGRLQNDRGYRDSRRRFFIEGVRNVVQAIGNGFDVEALLYSDRLLTVPIARQLVRRQRRAGTPTLQVAPEVFRRVSKTLRASGVGAIVKQHWSPLKTVSPADGLCWIVLEAVRSEGNLGTLIRSSEAVGGAGFILVGPGVDPFHPGVVRASMGALFSQRLVRTTYPALAGWLQTHAVPVVGASPDGSTDLHELNDRRPALVVLGEERAGLSAPQRRLCTSLVRIPMTGSADSLNVAVAGSLLMYEVYRAQSRPKEPG